MTARTGAFLGAPKLRLVIPKALGTLVPLAWALRSKPDSSKVDCFFEYAFVPRFTLRNAALRDLLASVLDELVGVESTSHY